MRKVIRRILLTTTMVPVIAVVAGCGADEPRMVKVPEFKGTETEAQTIPGRPGGYGQSKKYQDAMNPMRNVNQ